MEQMQRIKPESGSKMWDPLTGRERRVSIGEAEDPAFDFPFPEKSPESRPFEGRGGRLVLDLFLFVPPAFCLVEVD